MRLLDNAKKVVEVDLQEKGTPLHEASVIGDSVGDPYKDTSSVALNPIIKFSTLFGLLATEISIELILHAEETGGTNFEPYIGVAFFLAGMYFVWRSFYKMRIPKLPPVETIPEAKVEEKGMIFLFLLLRLNNLTNAYTGERADSFF